jgi:hypothetical protein
VDSSGFGYRPPRFHLLDQELHLDPDIQRMARELETRMAARQMVGLWLRPDFSLPAWQNVVYQPVKTVQTVQTPVGPMFSPDDDRSAPQPAVLSDVTDAIYKLPVVQGLVERAHDEGLRRLRLLRAEWNRASPGERTVMVTMTSIVVGSSIGIILANQPTRQGAFDFIKGKSLPVPFVDPLHFQILDRGGAISADFGRGLSGSARLQFPGAPSHPDYNVMITLDVVKLVRSR